MDQIISSVPIPNISSLCRLCLCEDENMLTIFNESNIYLPQRIAACVNIEVYKTDDVSTLICMQCLNKVNDWHEFKKYCDDSQSKLRYWSLMSDSTIYYKDQLIKQEFVQSDENSMLFPYVEDIKIEPNEIYHDETWDNEENDHVSTAMNFSVDQNDEINQESESLLVPNFELPSDIHGLNAPLKKQATNNIPDLKIAQVHELATCKFCQKYFSSKTNLVRHERNAHMVSLRLKTCFLCNLTWKQEVDLLDHIKVVHSKLPNLHNTKNGFTDNSFDKSHEYLKQFVENLNLLRNKVSSATQISLNSFIYYNQYIQKMIDRNCFDLNLGFKKVLNNLLNENLVILNTCHLCCISFKNMTEFKHHISKRYCKKRVRLVESGQIQPNLHFKCNQCDRILGCKLLLTHHIKSDHIIKNVPDKCNSCKKPFQSKHEYYAHMQETCKYQIFCSICELLFDTTDDFNLHSKAHEESNLNINLVNKEKTKIINIKKQKYWKNCCCLCLKIFCSYNNLTRHFKNIHFNYKLKTCKYCGDNFTVDEDREEHINYVHLASNIENLGDDSNKGSHIYLCIECNITFSTYEDLKQHKTVHNNKICDFNEAVSDPLNSPLFTCNICAQTFYFENELNQHTIQHDDNKINNAVQEKFTCTICNKTYNSKRSLAYHSSKMHNIIKKKNIRCLKCHKTLKSSKAKNLHQKKYHYIPMKNKYIKKNKTKDIQIKSEKDKYDSCKCIICKKIFPNKKKLLCHARIHYQTNDVGYPQCELCGKAFKKAEILMDHFKTHSTKSLSKLLSAKLMERIAKSFKIYPEKHSAKKKLKKLIQFNCILCNKQFGSKKSLSSHRNNHIHKGDSFKCVVCLKSYLFEEYNSHMTKIHNNIYHCIICNKQFLTINSLNGHKGWHYR